MTPKSKIKPSMQGARQRKREIAERHSGFSSDDLSEDFSEDQVDQIEVGSSHDTSITDHKESDLQFDFELKQ